MLSKRLGAAGSKIQGIRRRLIGHLLDAAAVMAAGALAFELRFDGALPPRFLAPMETAVCVWAVAKSAAFLAGSVNWNHWRYTSVSDAARIVIANTCGSLAGGAALIFLFGPWGLPRSIFIVDWLLASFLVVGLRLGVRMTANTGLRGGARCRRIATLIYGAGDAGLALARELRKNHSLGCDVVGLIDDDAEKAGCTLQGMRVLGSGEDLGEIAQKRGVERVLIAIPTATGAEMARILRLVIEAGVEYKTVPSLGELIQGAELGKQIREVAVEDLLGRKPVQLDLARIRDRIQGKVVLVTGAAGSIGSEVCRQAARFNPKVLVGFDEAETSLFYLDREMSKAFPGIDFNPEIGSINRSDALRRVMLHYQPAIVYHAAAYKHVPLMERHVFAAVETNIFGTWNVARAAVEHRVEDFVMISTDKAVRPASMMGATKRAAELLIRALHSEGQTRFVAVRFGNVLGSNGSVVPIFKQQIAAGGPVTVTHPEIRRYFMTIPEAAQLVLQAFSIGAGGEIFVLDMGEPVRIADLARNLILLSGLRPTRDIEIQYTGLRPGEKMYEELNLQDERLIPTCHPKIRSYLSGQNLDLRQINAFLRRLQAIAEVQDVAGLVLLMKELIPDYNPGSQLLRKALLPRAETSVPFKVPNLRATGESQVAAELAPAPLLN